MYCLLNRFLTYVAQAPFRELELHSFIELLILLDLHEASRHALRHHCLLTNKGCLFTDSPARCMTSILRYPDMV